MNKFESSQFFVSDGDTIIIYDRGDSNLTVRLRLIDCAERQRRGQSSDDLADIAQWSLGQIALQRAVETLRGRTVEVSLTGTDWYGRGLADVRVSGTKGASQTLQSRLVRAGLAVPYFSIVPDLESVEEVWLYRRLVVDCYRAKLDKLGFWSPGYLGELPHEFRSRKKVEAV
ncbi:MAG: thermonuclease family protein [Oscillatoria sp. SIO1A7]|nr:thermonuclease family protein [Oscillatoria sp. SIO1A7]